MQLDSLLNQAPNHVVIGEIDSIAKIQGLINLLTIFHEETNGKIKELHSHSIECIRNSSLCDVIVSVYDNVFNKEIEYFLPQKFSKNLKEYIEKSIKGLKSDLVSLLECKRVIHSIVSDQFNKIVLENIKTSLLQSSFSLYQNDFSSAGFDENYEEYLLNYRIPQCHDFAFYILNEENYFPSLFNTKSSCIDFGVYGFIRLFETWGYQLIKTPSAGDLVFYKTGSKFHFGIWTKNERVVSKWWICGIFEHLLEEVPKGFGKDVWFFRKKIKSFIERKFLDEIEVAIIEVAKKASRHPASYTPLSSLGCIDKMCEIFKKTEIKNVFSRSMYNCFYNEELKSSMINKTCSILELSYTNDLSKEIILKVLKNCLVQSVEEMKDHLNKDQSLVVKYILCPPM